MNQVHFDILRGVFLFLFLFSFLMGLRLKKNWIVWILCIIVGLIVIIIESVLICKRRRNHSEELNSFLMEEDAL